MEKRWGIDLPIRLKVELASHMYAFLDALFQGKKQEALHQMDEMKKRALFLDEEIQQELAAFIQQALFQESMDPAHLVTEEVQKAADRLIHAMGFSV